MHAPHPPHPHPTSPTPHFVHNARSIHTCRFKYNEENEQAFMTANATGGFVQRSGEIRKWLFGVMYVTGTEGTTPLEISGCYMIRGQDMEPLQVANGKARHFIR